MESQHLVHILVTVKFLIPSLYVSLIDRLMCFHSSIDMSLTDRRVGLAVTLTMCESVL